MSDKVYVVTAGEYSDYHIKAVFTDKSQAELYCAINSDGYIGETIQINEYIANVPKLETNKEPKIEWNAYFNRGMLDGISKRYVFNEVENIKMLRSGIIRVTITLDKNIDELKAKKIVREKLAKWLSEQIEKGGADNER